WDWRTKTSRTFVQQSRVFNIFGHPDGTRIGVYTYSTAGELSFVGVPGGSAGEWFSPDGRLFSPEYPSGTVSIQDLSTGLPFWRAPILLPSPPELYTHRGWQRLDVSSAEHSGASDQPAAAAGAAAGVAAEEPKQTAWRQAIVERARLANLNAGSGLLCLVDANSRIELWDTAADRLLGQQTSPAEVSSALAMLEGCVVLAGEEALLVDRAGIGKRLATEESTAIAWQADTLLVAARGRIQSFDADGNTRRESYKTGPGVTATAIIDDWLVVGFNEGQIDLLPLLVGQKKPSLVFAETDTTAVVNLHKGPMGTLIAGYASGMLGIWELKNGTILYRQKLHGPVRHLLLVGTKLYAATEVGDYTVLDLAVLEQPYCELVRRLWNDVPVVWENGLPVVRAPPTHHRCARTPESLRTMQGDP
ncbi:MAG: hypothetical protein V2A73_06965, partial [Pseudomonadota bacterium]